MLSKDDSNAEDLQVTQHEHFNEGKLIQYMYFDAVYTQYYFRKPKKAPQCPLEAANFFPRKKTR